MNASTLPDFLWRELLPTPGRGGATLRTTLACLITIVLVLMFRMPHGLLAFVVIYLITQEDTAATVLGSILGWVALTAGFATTLLALELSLDTSWLRICFFAGYFFVGLPRGSLEGYRRASTGARCACSSYVHSLPATGGSERSRWGDWTPDRVVQD